MNYPKTVHLVHIHSLDRALVLDDSYYFLKFLILSANDPILLSTSFLLATSSLYCLVDLMNSGVSVLSCFLDTLCPFIFPSSAFPLMFIYISSYVTLSFSYFP